MFGSCARAHQPKVFEDLMLRIIVMRHAKSSWNNPLLTDHDRPLNKRGVSDSPKMARKLMGFEEWIPTCIFSSTAKRAQQTRELFLKEWMSSGQPSPSLFDQKQLYFGGVKAHQSLIANCTHSELPMFVGHNPDIEELLTSLTGEEHRITTANIALIEHSAQQFEQAAKLNNWRLVELFRPRPPRS